MPKKKQNHFKHGSTYIKLIRRGHRKGYGKIPVSMPSKHIADTVSRPVFPRPQARESITMAAFTFPDFSVTHLLEAGWTPGTFLVWWYIHTHKIPTVGA